MTGMILKKPPSFDFDSFFLSGQDRKFHFGLRRVVGKLLKDRWKKGEMPPKSC